MSEPKRLAFIHTSHVLIPLFTELAKKHLPGVETFHMTDESLIQNTIRAGKLTDSTARRVAGMIGLAHDGGADVVMVTCSSIGKATSMAREQFDFPVLRIDESLAEEAVQAGSRIGVAATLSTTLDPTVELLQETADRTGRTVTLIPRLAAGAFEAVVAGDTARHDELLLAVLHELRREVDVIVLAQASMARVAALLPAGEGPLILSSPELAVRRAAAVIDQMKKAGSPA
ncbi:MAG TPA: aspartate/glutamate racemase family protein [Bryobacteraceae bacterium]|nr:aspartate/glutamate racemase family protein [Bryobacteraceae bacterium]